MPYEFRAACLAAVMAAPLVLGIGVASAADIVTLSGVLRTADGQPVPGAYLEASSPQMSATTHTDSQGAFSLQAPTGAAQLVVAAGNGQPASLNLPSWFAITTATNFSADRVQDLTLPAPVAITANVHDTTGAAVPGTSVYSVNPDPISAFQLIPGTDATGSETPRSSTTSDTGTAVIYVLPAPSLASVYADQTTNGVLRRDVQHNIAATTPTTINFTLPPPPITLSGVLRTADGQPVPGAYLEASSPQMSATTHTDSQGAFSLQAPTGAAQLVVAAGNGQPASLNLPSWFAITTATNFSADRVQDLTLPAPVAITANVHDTTGAAVPGTSVYSVNPDPISAFQLIPGTDATGSETPRSSTTSDTGTAVIYVLPAPSLASVYADQTTNGVLRRDVQHNIAATTPTTINFTLPPPPITLSGVLRTADGQPVPGAYLEASSPQMSATTHTDSQGAFSLQAPTGAAQLVVAAGNGQPASLNLPSWFAITTATNFSADRVQDLTLPAPVAITANVHDTTGAAVPGTSVYSVNQDPISSFRLIPGTDATGSETPRTATTSATGTAVIYVLPAPSLATVYADQTTNGVLRRDVQHNVAANAPTTIDFTLPSPPGPPQQVVASPLDASVDVAWSAPATDGGSAVTDYAITAVPDTTASGAALRRAISRLTVSCARLVRESSVSVTAPADARSIRLTGLSNGVRYTISVVARNAIGTSPAATAVVTPAPTGYSTGAAPSQDSPTAAATQSPAGTATPSATPTDNNTGATSSQDSPTVAPSQSPAGTPTASPCVVPNAVPQIVVNPFVVKFGQTATVTITGTPGATVDLFIRKYRGDFMKIRDGLRLDGTGRLSVATRPDMNLRFMARDRTVAVGSDIGGTSGLMTVEKQVSINVKRVGVNRFTFTGSISPMHPGASVNLFRNGALIKSDIAVSASRVYNFTTTLSAGTFKFQIRSGSTGYNAASASPSKSVRIY